MSPGNKNRAEVAAHVQHVSAAPLGAGLFLITRASSCKKDEIPFNCIFSDEQGQSMMGI